MENTAGMNEAQLKEALEHDAAQKAAQATSPAEESAVEAQPEGVKIGIDEVVASIEMKQALLAKSVALALTQVAQQFVDKATEKAVGNVTANGQIERGNTRVDSKTAENLLGVAGKALELSRLADQLGDRAFVRKDANPAKGPSHG